MPKGYKHTKESIEKMRQSKLKKPTKYWSGKTFKQTEDTKIKKSLAAIKNGQKPPSPLGRRKENPVTPEIKRLRMSLEYKLWRESVFKRDNYTCIWCFSKSKKLNADHIKRFAHYPELRFAIDNGRTLCEDCHKTTETFGNKKQIYG